jgi:hypothetical protein
MSRSPSSSIANPLLGLAVAAGLSAMIVVSPARAGIGDFVRKAKDKATQTVDKKTPPTAQGDHKVVFDEVVVELTDERLDHIVHAFKAVHDAGAGRPDLVEKLTKASDERNTHQDKYGEAIRNARNKRDEVELCYHDGYRAVTDKKTAEYQQKALTDPAIREKFTRAAQQYNAAAARGDSTAIQKLQSLLAETVGMSRADSEAVRAKCGAMPGRLAAEDRLDAMDQRIESLNESIRQIDEKVADAQANEGGLDRRQFAMALERIQMYLSWRKSKSYSKAATRGFTEAEIEALEKRLEELEAALG